MTHTKSFFVLFALMLGAIFAALTLGATSAHASGCAFPITLSNGQQICPGGAGNNPSAPKPKPAPKPAPTHTYHPVAPKHTYHPVAPKHTYHPVAPKHTYHPAPVQHTYVPAPVKHVAPKHKVVVHKKAPAKRTPVKKATPTPIATPTPSSTPTAAVTPSATPTVTPAPALKVQNAAHVSTDKGSNTGLLVGSILGAFALLAGLVAVLFRRNRSAKVGQ